MINNLKKYIQNYEFVYSYIEYEYAKPNLMQILFNLKTKITVKNRTVFYNDLECNILNENEFEITSGNGNFRPEGFLYGGFFDNLISNRINKVIQQFCIEYKVNIIQTNKNKFKIL